MAKNFAKVGLALGLLIGSASIVSADCTPAIEQEYKDEIVRLIGENRQLKKENEALKKNQNQKNKKTNKNKRKGNNGGYPSDFTWGAT